MKRGDIITYKGKTWRILYVGYNFVTCIQRGSCRIISIDKLLLGHDE